MSAKVKPGTTKPRTHHYAFKLPDGRFIGRAGFHDPLGPQPANHALPYSAEGIRAKREEILQLFPTAKIVPAPRWNSESGEYETPADTPPLN